MWETVETSRRTGGARERVLAAALNLFARHGVSGTSLQMIADDLGVTKAAVYHQFRSKEDIVWAVISPALEELARVVQVAESRRRRGDQVATALSGVVDLVVRNRRLAAVILADPTVGRLVRESPEQRAREERINRILAGPEPDEKALVTVVMVSGGLLAAGMDPQLADMDADVLRTHLLHIARRMLGLSAVRRTGT